MPAIGMLGDVMLGRAVARTMRDGAPAALWSEEVRAICASLDLVVCNLECCISDRGRKTKRIAGKPFFFRAPSQAVDSLRAIGVAAVSLANNHLLDYEEDALDDTLVHLKAAQIAAAGAGRGTDAARRDWLCPRAPGASASSPSPTIRRSTPQPLRTPPASPTPS